MPDPQTSDPQTDLHPWYGPCDSLAPNGQCAECLKVAQLAEDDAGILAAAMALAWDRRIVLASGEEPDPIWWWSHLREDDRQQYLRQARVACTAWEMFWRGKGR